MLPVILKNLLIIIHSLRFAIWLPQHMLVVVVPPCLFRTAAALLLPPGTYVLTSPGRISTQRIATLLDPHRHCPLPLLSLSLVVLFLIQFIQKLLQFQSDFCLYMPPLLRPNSLAFAALLTHSSHLHSFLQSGALFAHKQSLAMNN